MFRFSFLSLFFLISAFITLSGCTNSHNIDNPNDTSRHNCMDINGTVLGRLHPGSHGHLYRMERIDFPAPLFARLLEFFGQYHFTIDENDPDDHEIGIERAGFFQDRQSRRAAGCRQDGRRR